jgi:hypothetical protein
MAQRSKRRQSNSFSTIHPHAAGIDVGATHHVVAVAPDRDPMPVRTFRTFSGDLHRLADWLHAVGITTIAMESTGVYWIPVFEILEARGFEVVLVNARDVKQVPGRKTDVNDAQWLQQLHQFGLLRGSFRPRETIVELRAYLRLRERLIEYAAAHILHMQKALMEMNVQLHHAVTDITGVTGMRIIRAIVAGERRPEVLAAHRDVRCAASEETLCAALTGHYRSEHVFALRQAVDLYDMHQTKIAECDVEIERALKTMSDDKPIPETPLPTRRHGKGTKRAAVRRARGPLPVLGRGSQPDPRPRRVHRSEVGGGVRGRHDQMADGKALHLVAVSRRRTRFQVDVCSAPRRVAHLIERQRSFGSPPSMSGGPRRRSERFIDAWPPGSEKRRP